MSQPTPLPSAALQPQPTAEHPRSIGASGGAQPSPQAEPPYVQAVKAAESHLIRAKQARALDRLIGGLVESYRVPPGGGLCPHLQDVVDTASLSAPVEDHRQRADPVERR